MKIAANLSLLFTELPLAERVLAARVAGFDGVEIQFPYELPAVLLKGLLDRADLPLILPPRAREVLQMIEGRRFRPVPYDPKLLVHTIWDLGWNDQTFRVHPDVLIKDAEFRAQSDSTYESNNGII